MVHRRLRWMTSLGASTGEAKHFLNNSPFLTSFLWSDTDSSLRISPKRSPKVE